MHALPPLDEHLERALEHDDERRLLPELGPNRVQPPLVWVADRDRQASPVQFDRHSAQPSELVTVSDRFVGDGYLVGAGERELPLPCEQPCHVVLRREPEPEHDLAQPLARFGAFGHRLPHLFLGHDSSLDQERAERGPRHWSRLVRPERRVLELVHLMKLHWYLLSHESEGNVNANSSPYRHDFPLSEGKSSKWQEWAVPGADRSADGQALGLGVNTGSVDFTLTIRKPTSR